jgi:hypothetical protein
MGEIATGTSENWTATVGEGRLARGLKASFVTAGHRGAGIRTRDLLLPKQARYRTAPHPAVILLQELNCAYTLPRG